MLLLFYWRDSSSGGLRLMIIDLSAIDCRQSAVVRPYRTYFECQNDHIYPFDTQAALVCVAADGGRGAVVCGPFRRLLDVTLCSRYVFESHPLRALVSPALTPHRTIRPAFAKQRAAYLASCWLRAAKRVASKRALTVALAFTLAFPSLSAPRFLPGGTEGGLAAGGAGSAHPAVELVLPFSENAAAAEQSTPASVTGGARGVREQHQQHQGGVSGGAGRTAASRAAFVGPWGKEEGDRGGGGAQGARSSSKGGLSAAAVRAPSRRVGGKKRGKAVENDGTKEALRSMATKAGVNGREIAEDFGGHIQVCGIPSSPCCCLLRFSVVAVCLSLAGLVLLSP